MARGYLARQIVFPLIVACGLTSGQNKPNLNGVWKMDPARSDFGAGPVSESRLDKIDINGVNLKDTITQKLQHGAESTYDMIYTIDGKECLNHMGGDNEIKTKLTWDGNDLVGDSVGSYEGNDFTAKDRWVLSDGGKTMTVTRHISAGGSDFDMKFVFAKQ